MIGAAKGHNSGRDDATISLIIKRYQVNIEYIKRPLFSQGSGSFSLILAKRGAAEVRPGGDGGVHVYLRGKTHLGFVSLAHLGTWGLPEGSSHLPDLVVTR